MAAVYDDARNAVAGHDIAFIPTASPGFNDSGVRTGHPAAPRYLEDVPDSPEGQVFSKMMSDVVVSRTDPQANHILMINSFNEWHEDTQIEPTIVADRTNVDDSGTQQYTEGHFYEGYGDLYLNILRATTLKPGDYTGDGTVDAADYTLWRDSMGRTGLGIPADGNHDGVVDQLDHEVWKESFTPASGDSSSDAVPEPAAAILLVMIIVISLLRVERHSPRSLAETILPASACKKPPV